MTTISANYRELQSGEIDAVAKDCASAWQDPEIPMRQYDLAVKSELEGYRTGKSCAPFDALVKCLHHLPSSVLQNNPKLLDIGASGGYYSEVLRIAGVKVEYTGCDFSPAFKDLAETLYPGIAFDLADARKLPYRDDCFDIVLSGANLMHIREYKQAIQEAARVSKKYVIFHRTPIVASRATAFYVKDAYEIPCLEIHFAHGELMCLFQDAGLRARFATDVFRNSDGFCHRTYLLEKGT